MNSFDVLLLINFANEKVLAHTGRVLTDVEKKILQQTLEGKKLKDIQVCGYGELTVQRHFCPKLWKLLSEALGQEVGFKKMRLVLENLLQAAIDRGQSAQAAGLEVSPVQVQPDLPPPPRPILQNLPAPTCTAFIGRTKELARLLELLSPDHAAHLISVDGIGGVGKTTFVLEAAYWCLRASQSGDAFSAKQFQNFAAPDFEVIIFTSAKELRLTPVGVQNRLFPQRTLNDILRQVTLVLGEVGLAEASVVKQVELIKASLAQRHTLLIVDNLETVIDREAILAFLYELPPTVKVVITTREQIIFVPVRLTPMPESDGLALIDHEAQEKGVWLPENDRLRLYQATGGIPIAISYAIGQIASGYAVDEILQHLKQQTGDVAQFCFANSVQPLRGKPAHDLLMALTLFPAPALSSALIQIAVPQVDQDIAYQGLAHLRGLSLVKQDNQRYGLLPLTHEYALAELNAYPEFAKAARQRWLRWYLDFSATHGSIDIDEWQGHGFDELTAEWQNLQAVMEWCIAENRYTEALQLWQNLEPYTQFRGRNITRLDYWNDRLVWTTWLTQMAEHRGDWQALMQMRLDRAWTLTSLAKPELLDEAEGLLMQTWALRHHQTPLFQANLAQSIAILCIAQRRLAKAHPWLHQVETLLNEFPQPENLTYRRLFARLPGLQGIVFFETEAYAQAKQKFTVALDRSRQLNWARNIAIMQSRLAQTAIELGELDDAQRLLADGLYLAEANHDRTHLAYSQRAWAKLAAAQGDISEAIRWATAALATFDALGMEFAAKETRRLLSNYSSKDEG
jgi:LuxR family glucitol operon transcriptional activator